MEKLKNVAIVIICIIVGAAIMLVGVSFGGRRGQTQAEPAVTQVTETEVEAPATEDVEQPAEAETDRTEATAPEAVDVRTDAEVDRTETPDSFVDDGQNEGSTEASAAMSDEDYALKGYVVFMEMNSIGYAFESEDAKWVGQNIGDDSSWCRGLEAALKGSAIPTSDGPAFFCEGDTAGDFELAWGGAKVYVMPSRTNTWALAKAAMASAKEVGTYECEYGTYTVYAQ
ncbi:MAG: hypothetical protein K5837_01185 [Candidatus Saccharibacteria bacterium]|nr:hypothetical protein [Candidatus Saccharibacteria bacterium]